MNGGRGPSICARAQPSSLPVEKKKSNKKDSRADHPLISRNDQSESLKDAQNAQLRPARMLRMHI